MTDQDLMAQFMRDYSLLLRTAYYSRITGFLLTNIEPFYWEDSYE